MKFLKMIKTFTIFKSLSHENTKVFICHQYSIIDNIILLLYVP